MNRRLIVSATYVAGILFAAHILERIMTAQAPATVSQVYGLTFERDDFTEPPAVAGVLQTTFKTQVPPRTNFMLVFRNGLLEREGADYTKAPAGSVTFVIGGVPVIAEGDLITILYNR